MQSKVKETIFMLPDEIFLLILTIIAEAKNIAEKDEDLNLKTILRSAQVCKKLNSIAYDVLIIQLKHPKSFIHFQSVSYAHFFSKQFHTTSINTIKLLNAKYRFDNSFEMEEAEKEIVPNYPAHEMFSFYEITKQLLFWLQDKIQMFLNYRRISNDYTNLLAVTKDINLLTKKVVNYDNWLIKAINFLDTEIKSFENSNSVNIGNAKKKLEDLHNELRVTQASYILSIKNDINFCYQELEKPHLLSQQGKFFILFSSIQQPPQRVKWLNNETSENSKQLEPVAFQMQDI